MRRVLVRTHLSRERSCDRESPEEEVPPTPGRDMADRFGRDDDVAHNSGAHRATGTETRVHDGTADRDRVDMPPRLDDGDRDGRLTTRGGVDRSTMAAVRERQREEF